MHHNVELLRRFSIFVAFLGTTETRLLEQTVRRFLDNLSKSRARHKVLVETRVHSIIIHRVVALERIFSFDVFGEIVFPQMSLPKRGLVEIPKSSMEFSQGM